MDFTFITGPRQVHGARTAEEYRQIQARHLGALVQQGRIPAGVVPHAVSPAPVPYIGHGRWMLDCPCGNGVSVGVEMDLACCLECGAIYTGLVFPEDRARIEALLVARPKAHRLWNAPHTIPGPIPEPVEALIAENVARGWACPVSLCDGPQSPDVMVVVTPDGTNL